MTADLQRVLSHFNAEGGKAICPFCKHQSLQIDGGKKRAVVVHCWNCSSAKQAELAQIANTVARDTTAPVHKMNVTVHPRKVWTAEQLKTTLTIARQNLIKDKVAQQFLSDRGIPLVLAQSFALGSGEFYGRNRIVIPYTDGAFGENVLQLRYRQIKDTPSKVNKWRCDKRMLGGRRLFGLPLLLNWNPEDSQPLVVTESELDCCMLAGLDVAAISVDTAGHRLLEPDLILLRKVRNIVLAFDQDEAGAKCTARFKELLPAARVLGGYGQEGVKDLGDLYREIGRNDFKTRLERFLGKRTV